ncbi:MAG: LytTR family transcriptional regulator DNA-binding domain-containing protein [Gemmiger sp.]|nr:LytTR family transcriptional regulator DNA-binding domain-containing protein [Gemmiger sp.]
MVLIAIVEDNHADAMVLQNYIEQHLDEKQTTYRIHRYTSGIDLVRSSVVYNIVFMNIRADNREDLETARFLRIVNKEGKLILMSDSMQMAIYGYEAEALDFIIKPVDEVTINRAMDKVLKHIDGNEGEYFALKTPAGIVGMSTNDIYYVEVYDHDLVYHTEMGDYKVRGRLGTVCEQLESCRFLQCSRSYLVNVRYIQSLHRNHLVVNGAQIQIAKSHQKRIEQSFINYVGKCM